MFALQSLWLESDCMNVHLLVHYNQEFGVTESRDRGINSVLSPTRAWLLNGAGVYGDRREELENRSFYAVEVGGRN